MSSSIFNPHLLEIARQQSLKAAAMPLSKVGFVDPATAGGQGAPPPGGDPSGGGGAPPPGMDPSAMGGAPPPGMDPSAMGGAPPPGMDPSAGGGAPPVDPTGAGGSVGRAEIQAMIQTAMGGGGAAGAGGAAGGGPLKKKVDVNTEIYQIKKLLALIADSMKLPVPASFMMGDPVDDPHEDPAKAQGDPASAGYDPTQSSAIKPISPMQGASPAGAQADAGKSASYGRGGPIQPLTIAMSDRAGALARVLRQQTHAR